MQFNTCTNCAGTGEVPQDAGGVISCRRCSGTGSECQPSPQDSQGGETRYAGDTPAREDYDPSAEQEVKHLAEQCSALLNETSRLYRGIARLTAEKQGLVEALKQVESVCADNATAFCNHKMALAFVRDVARNALSKASAKAGE